MKKFDLAVVSHLRWNFVWQRPQQLLSRLSRSHRILFIEEPVLASESGSHPLPIVKEVHPGIVTLVPQLTAEQASDTPLWLWPCQDIIQSQVRSVLQNLDFGPGALWFYTPTPAFMVDAVKPTMIVYDVMDELSNFKFAPAQIRENEKHLLQKSAVVFTGGASLYDAKKGFNPNTHLFPSGVDSRHYAAAKEASTTIPDWMETIPEPRATYIGVVDERLDYDIIAGSAAACPDIHFLICGPIVKVDPASLPQGPNIHYPGQQSYDDLPRILKGSDVCLMPFARNEATRFISPTKTLEYMAAGRPIVSTPITDVERFYSDIVFLAESPETFTSQIRAALSESPETRERKQRREAKILTEQAWDAIADNMDNLMQIAWSKTALSRMPVLPVRKSQIASARPTEDYRTARTVSGRADVSGAASANNGKSRQDR